MSETEYLQPIKYLTIEGGIINLDKVRYIHRIENNKAEFIFEDGTGIISNEGYDELKKLFEPRVFIPTWREK